jgi:hypothetical protein
VPGINRVRDRLRALAPAVTVIILVRVSTCPRLQIWDDRIGSILPKSAIVSPVMTAKEQRPLLYINWTEGVKLMPKGGGEGGQTDNQGIQRRQCGVTRRDA